MSMTTTSMTTAASRLTARRRFASDRLDTPAEHRSPLISRRVDRDSVSRVAETIARFLGTGRYLAIQTCLVLVWIGLNIALPFMRWDPYPFILLNLAFSTQAAYAAPLILLAQNRQDDRDRAALAEDRATAIRVREDTEFLAREVAALRLSQSDAATRQYVRSELANQLATQLEALRGDIQALLRETIPAPAVPAARAMSSTEPTMPNVSCPKSAPDPNSAPAFVPMPVAAATQAPHDGATPHDGPARDERRQLTRRTHTSATRKAASSP